MGILNGLLGNILGSDFAAKFVASQARHVLVFLAGLLAAQGLITPAQQEVFISSNTSILAAIVLYLGAGAFSWFNKVKVQKVEDIASESAPMKTYEVTGKF